MPRASTLPLHQPPVPTAALRGRPSPESSTGAAAGSGPHSWLQTQAVRSWHPWAQCPVPLFPREKILEQGSEEYGLSLSESDWGIFIALSLSLLKQFEESQGRTSSKTAFYRALQNSLGGADADAGVQAAATWYYSLEHSADDYASFSRALENATR